MAHPAAGSDRRTRSLADLDAFREAVAVAGAVRALPDGPGRQDALAALEAACGFLGEATFVYERERKLRALSDARAAIGRTVAVLYLHHGIPAAEPVGALLARVEGTVVPAAGGDARWVAQLGSAR